MKRPMPRPPGARLTAPNQRGALKGRQAKLIVTQPRLIHSQRFDYKHETCEGVFPRQRLLRDKRQGIVRCFGYARNQHQRRPSGTRGQPGWRPGQAERAHQASNSGKRESNSAKIPRLTRICRDWSACSTSPAPGRPMRPAATRSFASVAPSVMARAKCRISPGTSERVSSRRWSPAPVWIEGEAALVMDFLMEIGSDAM